MPIHWKVHSSQIFISTIILPHPISISQFFSLINLWGWNIQGGVNSFYLVLLNQKYKSTTRIINTRKPLLITTWHLPPYFKLWGGETSHYYNIPVILWVLLWNMCWGELPCIMALNMDFSNLRNILLPKLYSKKFQI